ncbi:hypothetical protein [Nocardioides rubriscoriae]|uniref:hypothetical protein n=1 Tax=Nocardioides rubriscoriae TaxID=642762 RepID=UPI0011DF5ECC|nr:hypothetical protein [Nocardioides rubriscoriae]
MSDRTLDAPAPSDRGTDVRGATDPDAASAAATAQTLSTLGYGLFAWLQPGELGSIEPMRTVAEAVLAEHAPTAGDDDLDALDGLDEAYDATWAAGGRVPDTLFDEDLAAAEMLAQLAPADADPAESSSALQGSDQEVVVADEVPSYSTHRDTIAMLEEIAFLDE